VHQKFQTVIFSHAEPSAEGLQGEICDRLIKIFRDKILARPERLGILSKGRAGNGQRAL
jgi:hypothetical protein